jgi:hypothetical protein
MSSMLDTIEQIDDLSWVIFSEEQAPPCRGALVNNTDCPNEAVVKAIFNRPCTCDTDVVLYCLTHKEMLIEYARKYSYFICTMCGSTVYLVRFEPVK